MSVPPFVAHNDPAVPMMMPPPVAMMPPVMAIADPDMNAGGIRRRRCKCRGTAEQACGNERHRSSTDHFTHSQISR
jgi:hypothetical protein